MVTSAPLAISLRLLCWSVSWSNAGIAASMQTAPTAGNNLLNICFSPRVSLACTRPLLRMRWMQVGGRALRTGWRDDVTAAHERTQGVGHDHRTIGLLIVLEDRDPRPPDGQSR